MQTRAVVYSPDTQCLTGLPFLLHPGCQHPPSLLPAPEGWDTVVDAQRALHVVRWGPSPAGGLHCWNWPSVYSSIPHSFPTLTILLILLVKAWKPCHVDSSVIVTVCCIFTALLWNSTRTCNLLPPHPFLFQQHQTPQSLLLLHCMVLPGVQICLLRCHSC